MPEQSDFVSPSHERLHRRLELLGAGPALFFRDACRIMRQPELLATTTHVVGHLLREIEGSVLAVLHAQLVAKPLTIASHPEAAIEMPAPPAERASGDAESGLSQSERGLPETPQCDDEEEQSGHRTKVRAILRALSISEESDIGGQWLKMAGGAKGLHKVAHREQLNRPRPVTTAFAEDFIRFVELFDAVLDKFEAHYSSVYAQLDALIARPEPGTDGISLISGATPNNASTLGYFFSHLPHVGWLEPLRRKGFFRTLPPPEIDDEGRALQVHWAAANYLMRVAPVRPDIVTAIVDEVQIESDNVVAQLQLIEIMYLLRPEDRARLARRVKEMAPRLSRSFWGDQVVTFAAVLAEDGALELAVEMAALVLGIPQPDSVSGKRPALAARSTDGRDERAYDLSDAGERLLVALWAADGERALDFLADALDYHAGRRKDEIEADPSTTAGLQDFSRYWAQDLGRQRQHSSGDIRVFLTQAVRSTLRALGEREPLALPRLLGILRKHGARVLRRIELDVLAALVQSSEESAVRAALPIAVDRLTERALVIEDDVAPEWSALLCASYCQLEHDDCVRVLAAMQPPDFGWIEDSAHRASRQVAWRRDRLAVIAEHLTPDEKMELDAAIAAEGAPELLRHTGPHIRTFVGPQSPLEPAVLTEMSVDQVVGYMKKWEPRVGFAEATREGLGRQFGQLVAEQPATYAPWAPRFIGLEPTYVCAFLAGLAAAARDDRPFQWPHVLELAEWAILQDAVPIDGVTAAGDAARRWAETHRTVADLLGLGLARTWGAEGMIPINERSRLWKLIDALALDENPTPEDEARDGGTNMEPYSLAINSTRPEAIDAAIRYAYWVASCQSQSDRGLKAVLDTAPEVARLLESHLDAGKDPSPAVRAAIGIWLGSLTRTDGEWVNAHLDVLLPEDPESRPRRDALWDTFVQWTQPHPDVVPVLEPYYRAGIRRTGTDRGTRDGGKEADNRLADHVMTLYWWGELGLSDDRGLVPYFFTHADTARRRHAIHFVGFSLFHTKRPIAAATLERLRQLWEWRQFRLKSAITASLSRDDASVTAAREELEQFGWWFASGKFEPGWALAQLHQVLLLTGGVDLEHAVAERLEGLAGEHLSDVLRSLSAVDFSGRGRAFRAHSWLEHVRPIAELGLRSPDQAVQREALMLVNRVVAAGHLEFRALLRE